MFELALRFPERVRTAKEKVLYALWNGGEQCYCNLCLLTGLSRKELSVALKQLSVSGKVKEIKAPVPSGLDTDEDMNRYRLAGPMT